MASQNPVMPGSVTCVPTVAGAPARCYNAMVAQRASGDATLAGIRRRGVHLDLGRGARRQSILPPPIMRRMRAHVAEAGAYPQEETAWRGTMNLGSSSSLMSVTTRRGQSWIA